MNFEVSTEGCYSSLAYLYKRLSWTLTNACHLLLDELQLHVLDLDPDQQEVDLPNNHVLEVVSCKETHERSCSNWWLEFFTSIEKLKQNESHLDLLYSNSMCRQSSMPTSILIELLTSGYVANWWTINSYSFTKSDRRRTIVTLRKYLREEHRHRELQDQDDHGVLRR